MNKIILTGRLTKDINLITTSNNVEVASFNLAVNRSFKNQNGDYEADFVNCVSYRNTAKLLAEYTKKGDKIGVEGRLQTRNYKNNEGKTIYVTEVIVETIEFLEPKNKQEKDNNITNSEIVAKAINDEEDPFASFGEQIELSDKEFEDSLPF